jgi:serine/threonine protein kinase/tetratricopeptide (TPR) repeat protein
MIGSTISHYKILEKLGEGGMGIVYKAHDIKLDRTVALKFLPHHLTANEAEQARFLQEARAAAQINHPNVCSIIDIQEFNGEQYIVMEYVDGQTLRAKIQDSGLKIQDALTFAIQAAEAFHEAHNKGIVHRDIKCENIMVNSRNQIKVMDFGLAKLKGSLKLTRTSSTVGTLAYMAPEQIQSGEVDARSDIFSFGVVLFEMLTGHMPFRGEHEASMMYSIINEEPEPVTKFRPELSAEYVHIFSRCFEKDPADRYQSMNDLLIDLRRLKRESAKVSRASLASMPIPETNVSYSTEKQTPPPRSPQPVEKKSSAIKFAAIGGILLAIIVAVLFMMNRQSDTSSTPSGPGKKMMAVLPFENMGAPDQEYFADGITEEITSRLSGLSGLAVIARTSAIQYKKSTKPLKEIGTELGVDYVLQGTIRWGQTADGKQRVRVNPALIKVSDATQVWSQPYDEVLSDVFTMQSDIATQVANALGVSLLQPERKILEAKLTENSEAYDVYLRGRDYFQRSYAKQDFVIAIQMFERAVELDPKFAAAFAKMGETHAAMYWFFYDHSNDRLALAKQAIDKALALDPELSDAHQAFGYYYYWGFLDYENALNELNIALKTNPSNSRLLLGIGSVQRRQGKTELAAVTMVKAFELDPRAAEIAYNTAQTYGLLRKFDEAYRYIDRALALAPDVAQRILYKAELHWLSDGDTKTVTALIDQASATADVNDKILVQWYRALNEEFSGNYENALAVFSSGLTKPLDSQFNFIPASFQTGRLYALMGRNELSHTFYDSARVTLEDLINKQPEDARYHSALGLAYAGLGRKDDAIREGKSGVDLLPVSKEAWRGARRLRDLAKIYVLVGNYPDALQTLETLFAMPSEVTPTLLRLDPSWASIRNRPEFQKFLKN